MSHMRIRFTLFLVFIGQLLYGQEQQLLTKHDGLPSNVVYQVFQDFQQFLWITTDNGLARYDGHDFVHFRRSDGLADIENYELFETPQNNLVVAGSNGQVCVFDRFNQKFVSINSPLNEFISELSFISEENWLLSSYGDGYLMSNGKKKVHVEQDKLSRKCPISFIWNRNQNYHFINNCGVYKLNQNGSYSPIFEFETEILYSRACETRLGVLFSGRNNLFFIDSQDSVTLLKGAEQITSKTINRIQEIDDKFFASTYRGVVIFEIKNDSIFVEDHLLKDQIITSVQKDHENSFWFSSLRNGLIKISDLGLKELSDKETYEISIYNKEMFVGCDDFSFMRIYLDSLILNTPSYKHEYSSPRVKKVKKLGNETWLEIDGGLVKWSETNCDFYNTGVAYISQLNGQYIVGNPRGLYILTKNALDSIKTSTSNVPLFKLKTTPIENTKINAIEQNESGLLIAADNGVYRYNGHFEKVNFLPNLPVYKIEIIDSQEFVFYEGMGIVKIEANNYSLIFDESEFNQQARCLLVFENGMLIGTNNGILYFDKQDVFRHKLPFLQSAEIRDLELSGNKLIISSEMGLYSHEFPVIMSKEYETPVYRSAVYINDELVSNHRDLDLEYWRNNILIEFKTINFSDSYNQYRLNKGQWADFQNEIRLSELKPGNYSVEIRYGDDFVHKKNEVITMSIYPPWWTTTWFKLVVGLLILIVIYTFFKIRILTYNRDIVRELLMLALNYFKREKYILVKDVKDGSQAKVILSNLKYLESSKNYVTLYLENSKVVIRSSLKEIESRLNKEGDFIRCHRSFVVNSQKITAVHGDFLKIDELKIPIGSNYLKKIDSKLDLLHQ